MYRGVSMRKFLVLLFLSVSFILPAQQYVEDINGFDWINWSNDEKMVYIQGFMSAYSSITMRYYDEAAVAEEEVSKQEQEWLREYFFFQPTIGQIFDRINDFYSSYDNRSYDLIQVMLLAGGKDYWN